MKEIKNFCTEDFTREWRRIIDEVYKNLPDKLKTASNRSLFLNMGADIHLYKCVLKNDKTARKILRALQNIDGDLTELKTVLQEYYESNKKDAFIEREMLEYYRDAELVPIFVMTYKRWEKNATLNLLERFDSDEIYEKTRVFVDTDQIGKYKTFHPKFKYVAATSKTVGERMLRILMYCHARGIRYALFIEDEIASLNYLIKCGLEKCRCNSGEDSQYGVEMLKRVQHDAIRLMKNETSCSMVRIRNRVCSNNEDRSIYGHYEPTLGGIPDLMWVIDVERFIEIYTAIPSEHYSPQYDWAMLLQQLKMRKNWYVICSVCKDENMGGESVIADNADRMKLAEQMIGYYGVADRVVGNHVKSKRNSVKLRCLHNKNGIIGY